jgi:hypothetical protein
VTALVYGVDGEDVRTFGITRARAMEFRDARGSRITEADWTAIEQQLAVAYASLKRAITAKRR